MFLLCSKAQPQPEWTRKGWKLEILQQPWALRGLLPLPLVSSLCPGHPRALALSGISLQVLLPSGCDPFPEGSSHLFQVLAYFFLLLFFCWQSWGGAWDLSSQRKDGTWTPASEGGSLTIGLPVKSAYCYLTKLSLVIAACSPEKDPSNLAYFPTALATFCHTLISLPYWLLSLPLECHLGENRDVLPAKCLCAGNTVCSVWSLEGSKYW